MSITLAYFFLALFVLKSTDGRTSFIRCPKSCTCKVERNLNEIATCSEFIKDSSYSNIHTLNVVQDPSVRRGCNLPDDVSNMFPKLTTLNLSNCSLTYIPDNLFNNLGSLEDVDLSFNKLSDLSPTMFSSNTRLRFVNLQNNPLVIGTKPILLSNSIYELNLASCNISKLSQNTFKGVPSLKYLTLYDNKLTHVDQNTFPDDLKTINFGRNRFSYVPTAELLRLKRIKEIDLSDNPINCTCDLLGFQDWVSGKGVTFVNVIMCAGPKEYENRRLLDIPETEICDDQIDNDTSSEFDQISNNILPYDGEEMSSERRTKHNAEDIDPMLEDEQLMEASDNSAEESMEGSGDMEGDATTIMPDSDPNTKTSSTPVPIDNTNSNVSTTVSPADIPDIPDVTEPENNTIYSNSDVLTLATDGVTIGNAENNTLPTITTSETETDAPKITVLEENMTSSSTSTTELTPASDITVVKENSTSLNDEATPVSETIVTSENDTISNPTSVTPTIETPVSETIVPAENDTISSVTPIAETPVSESTTTEESSTSSSVSPPPALPVSDISEQTSTSSTPIPPSSTPVSETTVTEKNFTAFGVELSEGPVANNEDAASLTAGNKTTENSYFLKSSYAIPCLVILIIVVMCLIIYVGRSVSYHHKQWRSRMMPRRNEDTTELQDVELLSDKPKVVIYSSSERYPMEEDSEPKEPLMNGSDSNHWDDQAPTSNGKVKDNCGEANGKLDVAPKDDGPIESSIVKMSTFPEPKKPVFIENVNARA